MSEKHLKTFYEGDASSAVSALDQIGIKQKEIGVGAQTFGKSVSGVGLTMTKTLTPAAAMVGVAFKKSFDQWDTGFDSIRVQTGATGAALEGLGESMKNVGGKVTQPLSEVGTVLGALNTRTGQTGKGLEGLATNILNVSRITGTDATANVAAITRLFGDWSIATEDQSSTLDELYRASQATGIGVTQLAESVVQFGAPMRTLGFSFGETAGLLGKFEKEGVNSTLVMGGLRTGLSKLAKAGKDPRAELFGLMENIENAGLTAENKAKVFKMFGARAGSDMAKAIQEGRFELGDLLETIKSGSDTVPKATKDVTDLGDKFKMLGNKVAGALGPVGEIGSIVAGGVASLGPMLFGIGQVAPQLGKVGTAFKSVGGGIATAAKFVGRGAVTVASGVASFAASAGSAIASGARMAVSAVASAATTVGAWIATAAAAVVNAAIVAAAWVVAFAPFILIGVVIAGLVVLVVKHWTKIKDFLGRVWEGIKNTASTIWNTLVGFFKKWGIWMLAALTGPIGLLVLFLIKNWTAIKEFATRTWTAIKDKASAIWNGIKTTISNAVTGAINWVRTQFGRVRGIVVDAWNGGLTWLKGLPGRILSAVGNLGSVLYDAGRAILSGLWNGIASMFGWLRDKVGGIASKIASWKGPIPVDLQLLVPAGDAIMRGLGAGLEMGVDRHVKPVLRDLTRNALGSSMAFSLPALSANVAADGGHSRIADGAPSFVRSAGSSSDASLVREIRRQSDILERIAAGGDERAVILMDGREIDVVIQRRAADRKRARM